MMISNMTLTASNIHLIPSIILAEEGAAPSGLMTRDAVIEVNPGARNMTLDGQPLADIWSEVQARNAAFNATMNRVTALFVFPVFRAQDRVAVPSNRGFEQATELGQPTKRRVAYVSRGFPLDHYDTAYGYSQEFIDSAVGRDLLAIVDDIETDWTRLNMNVVLEAIFRSSNITDKDGVSVKSLYNADGEVPPPWKRYRHQGNHTHYLTSGDSTFDETNIQAMEDHLVHHGFENGLVLFVSRTDYPTIAGLSTFVPATSADRPVVVDGQIVGGGKPTSAMGMNVQGYVGLLSVVIEEEIPAGYILAWATGGTLSPRNVVGLRFHENPSARGLRLVQGPRQDYPIYDAFYDGYLGAGVRQRGAAVVMQATASSYEAPDWTF